MFNFEILPIFYGSLTFVEFLRLIIFSETIRARAMKLGSCIHLEKLRSTLRSILRLDLLFYGSLTMSSFCIKVIFSETIRARAMKLGSCIYLEELRSTLYSILRLDLYYGSLTNV